VVDALGNAMSGPDAETARRPEVRTVLADVITEAFRQSPEGAAHDIVLLGRPWGFSLGGVRVPVFLWQGQSDTLVPPAMGCYPAEHLPDCAPPSSPVKDTCSSSTVSARSSTTSTRAEDTAAHEQAYCGGRTIP
jgi:hypothetical protein